MDSRETQNVGIGGFLGKYEHELELFKKHFGEYKIINNFKGVKMNVTKRVKLVSVKPAGDGLRYALLSSDGEWYSTFDSKVGKYIESVSGGDTVEIEYVKNAKGFKNFSSVKLVENGEPSEEPPEEPPDEKGEEKPPVKQRRGIDRIDKNCISAGNMAVELMSLLDLSKLNEEGIVEKFKALWEIIKEEIER